MEDLAIIIDARPLQMYAVGKAGFHGASETIVRVLAEGLAARGHEVHVITPDLEHMEHRAPTEFWWGPNNHPDMADVVMAFHSLQTIGDLSAPMLVLCPNGIDPPLTGREGLLDAVCCFSQWMIDTLKASRPQIPDVYQLTGLGVDPSHYAAPKPVHGRMLWGNDPSRGLWHCLDIFDRVKTAVPEASLHVTYDFDGQFEMHKWGATAMAELFWECKRRLSSTPDVVSLGALPWPDMLREQLECDVHALPSDPRNVGTQTYGMLQMELAAAGVPLVLSDIECFPEVFTAAKLLPVVGAMRARKGNDMVRVDAQDWADVVIELMKSPAKRAKASKASRAMAQAHTWTTMLDRTEAMLETMLQRLQEQRAA